MRASRKVAGPEPGRSEAPSDRLGAYWAVDRAALAARLQSRPDRLSASEAAKRLGLVGPYQLRARLGYSRIRVLAAQVRSPLLLILVFAAVVSAFTGEWISALIVLVIVFATVGVGYSRELSARTAVAALGADRHEGERDARRALGHGAHGGGRPRRRRAAVGRQPCARRRSDSPSDALLRQRSSVDGRKHSRGGSAIAPASAFLYAIGYHFRDFLQVSDDDVVATLREARRPQVSVSAGPTA